MTETPRPEPVRRDWRMPLILGLAIGLSIGVARGLQANLEPTLGYLGVLAVSVAAAGVVGGLVSFVLYWLTKPREAKKT